MASDGDDTSEPLRVNIYINMRRTGLLRVLAPTQLGTAPYDCFIEVIPELHAIDSDYIHTLEKVDWCIPIVLSLPPFV